MTSIKANVNTIQKATYCYQPKNSLQSISTDRNEGETYHSSLMSVTNHSTMLKECSQKEHQGLQKTKIFVGNPPPPPTQPGVNSFWPTILSKLPHLGMFAPLIGYVSSNLFNQATARRGVRLSSMFNLF